MAGLWENLYFQMGMWGTVLLLMLIMGALVVRRFRESAVRNDDNPLQVLTNFREMKVQGDINDAEFRTIKALLEGKPPTKVKDNQ